MFLLNYNNFIVKDIVFIWNGIYGECPRAFWNLHVVISDIEIDTIAVSHIDAL